jgi:hypothetical protein
VTDEQRSPTAHFHRNPLGQKDIKLVDASIVFSDRLGSELITIRVLPDVVYPPDTPVPVTGKWPVTQQHKEALSS